MNWYSKSLVLCALWLAPSAVFATGYTANPQEFLSTTDQVTGLKNCHPAGATETHLTTDSVLPSGGRPAGAVETHLSLDSAAAVKGSHAFFGNPPAENLTTTDAPATKMAFLRSPSSESWPTGASVATASPHVENVGESHTTADVPTCSHCAALGLIETHLSLDFASTTQSQSYTRGATESLNTSDQPTAFRCGAIPETYPTTDSLPSVVVNHLRSIAELLTTSDAATRAGSFFRADSATLATGDAISRLANTSQAVTQTLATNDVANYAYSSGCCTRQTSENELTGDAAIGTYQTSRSASETVSTTDSAAQNHATNTAAQENYPTSDSAAESANVHRTTSEFAVVSDLVSRGGLLPRTASESLTYSDSATAAVPPKVRTATEQVTVGDTVAYQALHQSGASVVAQTQVSDQVGYSVRRSNQRRRFVVVDSQ